MSFSSMLGLGVVIYASVQCAASTTLTAPLRRPFLPDVVMGFVWLRILYDLTPLRRGLWILAWTALPALGIAHLLARRWTEDVPGPIGLPSDVIGSAALSGSLFLTLAAAPPVRTQVWRLAEREARWVWALAGGALFAVLELGRQQGDPSLSVGLAGRTAPLLAVCTGVTALAMGDRRPPWSGLAAVSWVALHVRLADLSGGLAVLSAAVAGTLAFRAAFGEREHALAAAFCVSLAWLLSAVFSFLWLLAARA